MSFKIYNRDAPYLCPKCWSGRQWITIDGDSWLVECASCEHSIRTTASGQYGPPSGNSFVDDGYRVTRNTMAADKRKAAVLVAKAELTQLADELRKSLR